MTSPPKCDIIKIAQKGDEDMGKQMSLADYEYGQRKRRTKRDEFLECMDEIIPWDEIIKLIEPYYYKNIKGRKAIPIETMFRMYLLQRWYSLSDEGLEDAIYDSYAMRKFMRIDFLEDSVPDATTLCKFRKLVVDNGIDELFFDSVQRFMEENGYIMRGGTIVDATIIDAPKSTKNQSQERDPEMHQTKKGNQWYFGAKLHVGVDAGTGLVHSVETTAANVSNSKVAHKLFREDDRVGYGDSAYCALEKHDEIQNDPNLSKIDFRVNKQKPYRKYAWDEGPGTYWLRYMEYQKSRVRSKVEYVFHIIKDIFGFRKTPYRGLRKLEAAGNILFASANLYMIWKGQQNATVYNSKRIKT